ncbi:MAG: GNAT family N-acetyltransferase [Patescibacteria group bacterium]
MIEVADLESVKSYWKKLVDLYVECFAEPPWYEVISIRDAEEWFREMLIYPKNTSLIFIRDGISIGATFAFPLLYKQDVAAYLNGNISQEDTLYFAEIFVEKRYRNKSIGTLLYGRTLELGKSKGFTHAVVRTNFSSKMFPILEKDGFETIGEQNVTSLKEIEGKRIEIPDKRGIFLKKL